ncbi:MAG: preprotein translocase subunit SecG [Candidatus Zapsychrus exili]|nr:preprotein translocase subunit SecG [Candidatus Zapsychrus exili]
MTGLIIFAHVIVSVLLVTVILMQSGRGGGLTEAFSSAESMFGAKTNEFLIKGTTVLSIVFLVTSLSLAFISSRKDKSLIPDTVEVQTEQTQEVAEVQAEVPVEAPAEVPIVE